MASPEGERRNVGGPALTDEARQRQLANLRRGPAEHAAWKPGVPTRIKHGLDSRRPSTDLEKVVAEVEAELGASVPVRVPGDRYAIELVAYELVRVRRCQLYLELHGWEDAQGNERPEVERLGRSHGRAVQMLEKLGCTAPSQIRMGLDLARTQHEELSADELEAGKAVRAARLAESQAVDADAVEGGDGACP